MVYRITLKEGELEIVEISLPNSLQAIYFKDEYPEILFLEQSLSVPAKTRVVAAHVQQLRLDRAAENYPNPVVDAPKTDK